MFVFLRKPERQKERHLVLAENHSHSQYEVSSFGEDYCDEAVLGIDATKRFLKTTGQQPSLSSYTAKEHTQVGAVEWGVGWERPSKPGLGMSPRHLLWPPRHLQQV